MSNNRLLLVLLLIAAVSCTGRHAAVKGSDTVTVAGTIPVEGEWDSEWIHRYSADVDALAEKAGQDTSAVDVVFFGSSSIRLWKGLDEMMAPLTVVNRGYGGATVRDILVNYDKIMAHYSPKAFVVFCDNDICGNENLDLSAVGVLDHYRLLFQKLEAAYPGIPVFFLSWKYSGCRAALRDTQKLVNDMMAEYAKHSHQVTYVDVNATLLLPDGAVDQSLFESDDLHINTEGYMRWTSVLKPHLLKVCDK